MQMGSQEEEVTLAIITEIIKKLGISEADFQTNSMFHGQDQMKSMKMMEMQQETMTMGSENEWEMLTREQAIDAFKVKLRVQLEQMDMMLKT